MKNGILAQGTIGAGHVSLYTVPEDRKAKITLWKMKNTNALAQTIIPYARQRGQDPIEHSQIILSNNWSVRVFGGKDGEPEMGPGESLEAEVAPTAGAVTYVIKGQEFPA